MTDKKSLRLLNTISTISKINFIFFKFSIQLKKKFKEFFSIVHCTIHTHICIYYFYSLYCRYPTKHIICILFIDERKCVPSATKVWFDHSTYTFVFGVILIRVLFRRTRNVILVGRRWYNFVSLIMYDTTVIYTTTGL